jgi:hypothetical protein
LTAGADNRWNVIYDDFELYGNYLPGGESEINTEETNVTDTQEEN